MVRPRLRPERSQAQRLLVQLACSLMGRGVEEVRWLEEIELEGEGEGEQQLDLQVLGLVV